MLRFFVTTIGYGIRTGWRAAAAGMIVVLGVQLVRGCGGGSACPMGQQQICRTQGDCRCGPPCNTQDDCGGTNACVHFQGETTQPGVCVDALWAFGTPPPCVPLCRSNQTCVEWNDRPNSCADVCTANHDCPTDCCLTLSDGSQVCAPAASYCTDNCNPPCTTNQLCVLLNMPTCGNMCTTDADCPTGCCLMLQSGGGACSPNGVDCPNTMMMMPPPPPCTPVTCSVLTVTPHLGAEAACGTYGSYDANVRNTCTDSIVCRGCWWDPATSSYSICNVSGVLPINAVVPIGAEQCADAALPDPPVKIRCVQSEVYASGVDCLGEGPMM